jgi:hypothetical protein
MKRIIHAKRLDKLTKVEFHIDDITIIQEGAIVVLYKEQILELARIITNEKFENEFYENMKTGRELQ